jgi:hypothetical protein
MAIERATEIHQQAEKRGVSDDIEIQREARSTERSPK